MEKNLEFQAAAQLLAEQVGPVGTEQVLLSESLGRVLGEDVHALGDVPPFDRSPFDGYAFRSADSAPASREQPVTLRVIEEIPAGYVGGQTVLPGTAAKILTGAPIPAGADCVCKFEDTVFTAETVTLFQPYRPGVNIIPRGEDLKAGALVAARGTVIDCALMGTLATQNQARPRVFQRPMAGIITTGTELREVGESLDGGKIANSNRYTFEGALKAAGCNPEFFGCPGDSVEEIAESLRQAARECDLILTTGGVSVGDYDRTPAALKAAGGTILLQNMRLKPGGKCCFGTLSGRLVCCLSGNPASSLTAFYGAVLPAVRRLCGRKSWAHRWIPVTLLEDFPKRSPKPRLLRGRLDLSGGAACIHIAGEQGNGILHTMVGCDVLALVPSGSGPLPQGTVLQAILLQGEGGENR